MKSFLSKDSGATAIEYAMIAAMIAVAIVLALALTGDTLALAYDKVMHLFD